jgi:hypothetical protein
MASPSIHIDDSAFSGDTDMVVVGGQVAAVVPRPLEVIIEPLVAFYPDRLRVHIQCEMPHCPGHFKYGMQKDRNLPVIFGHHRKEVAHYFAFCVKSVLPFRVPGDRHQIMEGIKWFSQTPRDGQTGLKMTCMVSEQ